MKPAAAKSISREGLDVLGASWARAPVAALILMFRSHASDTLGQVAQSDADYVRRLTQAAQRPDVGAAAARLLDGCLRARSIRGGRHHDRVVERGAEPLSVDCAVPCDVPLSRTSHGC